MFALFFAWSVNMAPAMADDDHHDKYEKHQKKYEHDKKKHDDDEEDDDHERDHHHDKAERDHERDHDRGDRDMRDVQSSRGDAQSSVDQRRGTRNEPSAKPSWWPF